MISLTMWASSHHAKANRTPGSQRLWRSTGFLRGPMGNRPPSTATVATVAALGAAAGYLAYAAYNYQQGDSTDQTPVAVEVASHESGDQADDDVDEDEDGITNLAVEDFSHVTAKTLIQTFCVAVMAVLMVITLVVSLLHSQVPTDLPMFAPLFWSTIGVGLTTSGIPFRASSPRNVTKGESNSEAHLVTEQPTSKPTNEGSDCRETPADSNGEDGGTQSPGFPNADDERKVDDEVGPNIETLDPRWSPSTASFQVRGKYYLDASHAEYKKKISSMDPLYEAMHVTVRRTEAGEMLNVNDIQDLPDCVLNEQRKGEGDSKGMTGTIPNILLLHKILPVEQPSIWGNATQENSPSIHLLAYFKLSDHAKENILSESNNNVASLLKNWIEPQDPLYDQWKTIIQLQNPEKIDIGMVGNQLIKQYNGKPFLSYGSASRDVLPNDKILVTVDVYKFSYAMRNFYISILQNRDPSVLNNAIVDMAFFLEGRKAEHLPEQILGSFAINDLRLLQQQ